MSRELGISERIGTLFTKQPKDFAVLVIVVGAFMVAATIENQDWIFQGHSYNTENGVKTPKIGVPNSKFGS
jgi:hypothetical protein